MFRFKLFPIVTALVFAVSVAGATALLAEDRTAGARAGESTPSEEEIMAHWREFAAPSAGHRQLDRMVGEWTTTSKLWMQGPGSEPSVSHGTATVEWVLGKRFLRQESHGTMLGQEVTGLGFVGYDNFKEKVVSVWMDDMGTAVYVSEGTFNEEGDVLTLYGLMDDPTTGERDKKVRYVTRLVDDDTMVFEGYDLSVADDFKEFEITFERQGTARRTGTRRAEPEAASEKQGRGGDAAGGGW